MTLHLPEGCVTRPNPTQPLYRSEICKPETPYPVHYTDDDPFIRPL